MNPTVQLLKQADTQELEAYLWPHRLDCLFICSNLKNSGVEYQDAPFHGQYWGAFSSPKGALEGVLVHYWNGNVMMFAKDTEVLGALVAEFQPRLQRPIAGVLGPGPQAEYVIERLGLSAQPYSVNRNEGLYELALAALDVPQIPASLRIVGAHSIDQTLLIEWMEAYEIEALGASKQEGFHERAVLKAEGLRQQDGWVLLRHQEPVALAGLNARLNEVVQVGPVWTPPAHRNQGYARLLLAAVLAEEREKGVQKAVLFTDNPAAVKAYEAIGFTQRGNYRLALLKKPWASGTRL